MILSSSYRRRPLTEIASPQDRSEKKEEYERSLSKELVHRFIKIVEMDTTGCINRGQLQPNK